MARATWRFIGMAVLAGVVSGTVAATSADAQTEPAAARPAPVLAATATSAPTGAHVRGLRTGVYDAAKLIDDASRACPTVRGLVDALDRSDVVVLVEVRGGVSNGRAQMTMLNSRAGVRWLRVAVDGGHQWRQQAAFLAHELRHAVEVAGALDVQDPAGMGRLYGRIGYPLGGGHYETAAAVAAEGLALREAYSFVGQKKQQK
jgi:hypothetical protein